MKYLLLGNGINIQFGGSAYLSDYIMRRVKYKAKLGEYDILFDHSIDRKEIVQLLDGFVIEANNIRNHEYDEYISDDEIKEALEDFQKRYRQEITQPHEIILEDWMFVARMFFLKNTDLKQHDAAVLEGFRRILLDAIYNEGKVQEIFRNLEKKKRKSLKRFLEQYDVIFTLNYDRNVESICAAPTYHLHGDFCVLSESENPECAMGYWRTQEGTTVVQEEFRHCYCNALVNYSGISKKKEIEQKQRLNAIDFSTTSIAQIISSYRGLAKETILAKKQHPELKMAHNYHFEDFNNIAGDLHIIGMCPNNDAHIISAIMNNPQITSVTFYYKSLKDKEWVEENCSSFHCESIDLLWKSNGLNMPEYNLNYPIRNKVKHFIEVINALSEDKITVDKMMEEINKVPQFEMGRLCGLVNAELQERNPYHLSINEERFNEERAAISYVALQEGLLPSVLYLIYIMNNKKD